MRVIDYVPGWPRIEGIQARLLFQGKTMEVTSNQARIYGVALSPVKAVIPDLLHHEELLHIDGEANGPIQDFIRFANFSPVGERLRGFTDALEGSGPMQLALKLQVPLRHSDDTTLAGRLSFLGDTLFPPGLPRLEQVRGDIDFTGDSLNAKNLTAQFLGGPLRIDTATRKRPGADSGAGARHRCRHGALARRSVGQALVGAGRMARPDRSGAGGRAHPHRFRSGRAGLQPARAAGEGRRAAAAAAW